MLCGIDEAGRGPLAGPVVVAGVVLLEDIKDLNDSKLLSEKKREKLFSEIKEKAKYHIVFKSEKEIDNFGISFCIKESILEIMQNLKEFSSNFLFDGNTNYNIENLQKEIKADSKYKEVSAASILAKVSRDNYMKDIAYKYPNYNFLKHKGYGTKEHIEEIKKFGRSDIHRFSYKLKSLGE